MNYRVSCDGDRSIINCDRHMNKFNSIQTTTAAGTTTQMDVCSHQILRELRAYMYRKIGTGSPIVGLLNKIGNKNKLRWTDHDTGVTYNVTIGRKEPRFCSCAYQIKY